MTSTRTHPWSAEETELLRSLVELHTESNWRLISKEFNRRQVGPKRSCKQCREHWLNKLSPAVNKGQWTETELQTLFQWHQRLGNAWSDIAKHLPGRTESSVKNVFYCAIRKALKAHNKNNDQQHQVQRTLKSLIHDRQTTILLGLAKESKKVLGESELRGELPGNYAGNPGRTYSENLPTEIAIPTLLFVEPTYEQMWHCLQWMWLTNVYRLAG